MTNPVPARSMNGGQPQEGQTRTQRFILPREITIDPDFQFRQSGIDKGHGCRSGAVFASWALARLALIRDWVAYDAPLKVGLACCGYWTCG